LNNATRNNLKTCRNKKYSEVNRLKKEA